MVQQKLMARSVQSGEASSFRVITDIVTTLATGEDTGGAYSMFESRTPPGSGVPPHFQRNEDETFFVLEGSYEFLIGDEKVTLGPGGYGFVPRDTVHAFTNVGQAEARMMILNVPGGYHEHFFSEVGEAVSSATNPEPPAGPPDFEHIVSIAAKYGIEILPPPGE